MKKNGFTLIEVMVSTGIIVLMLGVSLPAFLEFQKKQNLASGAEMVRDAILDAHSLSLAPRGADSSGGGGKPLGADFYRIAFVSSTDPDVYTVYEQAVPDPNNIPSTPAGVTNWTVVKSSRLPDGVEFCTGSNSYTPTDVMNITGNPDQSMNGIVYSVSRNGKIIDRNSNELYTQQKIVLRHIGSTEARALDIQSATGQVAIRVTSTASECL